MKTKLIYYILSAALYASCSQGDAAVGLAGETDRAPLIVTSPSLQAGIETRAGTYQALTEGAIGLFLDNAATSVAYKAKTNVKYTYAIPQWQPATEADHLYLVVADAAICAYYPYDAAVTDKTAFDVSAKILAPGTPPPAYGTNVTKNRTDNTVSFQMNQACAWLEINFTRGDIKDGVTLSGFSLVNAGLYDTYRINIATGADVEKTPATDGKITFADEIALAANAMVTRSIAMPPAPTLTGGLKVVTTLKEYDGKQMSVTLAGITALERATKYTVNLTVNATDIELTSVQVQTEWDNLAVKDDGDVPFNPDVVE